ncbi:MAG: ArsB/NhaD family transporter [Clostridia bacterium]|nr:ArsB/NhaD family transporter [Clostridia bacterium]
MTTPQIIALVVFILVMAAIVSEKIHRAAAAIAGAIILIFFGIIDFNESLGFIDFNTLGVLIGMMTFVGVVKESGLFEFLAIKSAKIAKGNPWRIMVIFIVITAVLSALLDNVTTVLLIGPMTLTICHMLEINPVPFLMTQILASNVGGTATLIGDPPNIMIGSAANLSFGDFIVNLTPVVIIILVVFILLFKVMYGRHMHVTEDHMASVMQLDEKKAIKDRPLFIKSIVMIIIVVLGFVLHGSIGVSSSVVALTAAAVMLIIGRQEVEHIICSIEWPTILFFVGLFVVVGGMEKVGIITALADFLMNATHGEMMIAMILIVVVSAVVSAILDNIPFVATMIPVIITMQSSGMDVMPLWWALSLGACLGGNGTLIGASANVVLSGISKREGYPITFIDFLKVGFPMMLVSVAIAAVYLVIRF